MITKLKIGILLSLSIPIVLFLGMIMKGQIFVTISVLLAITSLGLCLSSIKLYDDRPISKEVKE